jgi:hypothetical protein
MTFAPDHLDSSELVVRPELSDAGERRQPEERKMATKTETMDRREFIRSVVGGTAVVTAGATVGLTFIVDVAEAAPLAMDKQLPLVMDNFVQNAQVVVVKPGRRGRRRVRRCWWSRSRGRRVCGWRWV